MNLAGAPVQYLRDVWQGILNEIKRVDLFNAKKNEANRFLGTQTIAATLDAQQQVTISGDITPAQITADQNDYNPTGLSTATVLRLSTDAARNITGLQGGSDGRIIVIFNVGSFNITLVNLSGSSSAANQFSLAADLLLLPNRCCTLQYDSTSTCWRCIGANRGGFGVG